MVNKGRGEYVSEIINGDKLVTADNPFKDDILFYVLLQQAASDKEWYEVADFCKIQISHIENQQTLKKLK